MDECTHDNGENVQNCVCNCPRCFNGKRCICPNCYHLYRTDDPASH